MLHVSRGHAIDFFIALVLLDAREKGGRDEIRRKRRRKHMPREMDIVMS